MLGADPLLLDLHDADKLHYSDAVTNEAMRLRPVAPLYGLQTNEDVAIAGYQIPLCPGRSLALLESKAAMAMICRNFDVTFVGDPSQVREIFAFAMMPQGLTMRFMMRNQSRSDD